MPFVLKNEKLSEQHTAEKIAEALESVLQNLKTVQQPWIAHTTYREQNKCAMMMILLAI